MILNKYMQVISQKIHKNQLAPTFVFLASSDSSYVTGQVIHNNGGQVMP